MILGVSKPVQEMQKLIARVAPTKTNVLIIGDSGTGKELVARSIHDSGPMKDEPFVPVNCGAIPENLIESEFFGHKRGSFTGAVNDKPGLFEAANGGTLFLDEVGELPLGLQSKLLRAIQERTVRRVGGVDDIRVDVRIIAATNRDLEQLVRDGRFREDLYYRLNVILIRTPQLRERGGDEIELLAKHFLAKFAEKYKKGEMVLDPKAMEALRNHSWPGNVRELENAMERAVTMETGLIVSLATIEPALRKQMPMGPGGNIFFTPNFTQGGIDLDKLLGEFEGHLLRQAIAFARGDKAQAAKLLGVSTAQLPGRLKKHGIS